MPGKDEGEDSFCPINPESPKEKGVGTGEQMTILLPEIAATGTAEE